MQRPVRRVVRRPAPRTVVIHRTHYRPYHGVFVYGPRPTHHRYYRSNPNVNTVQQDHLPTRRVNRAGSLAVGIRSGSYLTGYEDAHAYGDFGLGITARYRPFEALGIEGTVTHHNQTWDDSSERAQTVSQGSVMVFANPWGRISPYALGGLTATSRSINDGFYVGEEASGLQTKDVLWGPHAGVGIEFAFGKSVALDLEARYVGYMNTDSDDPTIPGALQTSAGFLVHF